MDSPLVSVIVLNHNGVEHLPVCIESLRAQTYPALEIIVADNASTDESRVVCQKYPEVIFVNLADNHGFGKGNNLGSTYAHGEYLFFVNNDMRFALDVVSTLVNKAEADEQIFALDIKQYNWEGSQVIHSALYLKRSLDPRSSFMPFVGWTQEDCDQVVPVPFANGANFFCRRWMFEALGGFDSTFFIDHEDQDLSWRAWLRGWKTLYVPSATCWHKVGMAFGKPSSKHRWTAWTKKRQLSSSKNRIRFVMKTQSVTTNILAFISNHFLALVYLVIGRPFQGRVMLWSYWANVRELRDILFQRQAIMLHSTYSSKQLLEEFLL